MKNSRLRTATIAAAAVFVMVACDSLRNPKQQGKMLDTRAVVTDCFRDNAIKAADFGDISSNLFLKACCIFESWELYYLIMARRSRFIYDIKYSTEYHFT